MSRERSSSSHSHVLAVGVTVYTDTYTMHISYILCVSLRAYKCDVSVLWLIRVHLQNHNAVRCAGETNRDCEKCACDEVFCPHPPSLTPESVLLVSEIV